MLEDMDTNRCIYCEILLDQPSNVCPDCEQREGWNGDDVA